MTLTNEQTDGRTYNGFKGVRETECLLVHVCHKILQIGTKGFCGDGRFLRCQQKVGNSACAGRRPAYMILMNNGLLIMNNR